MNNRKKLPVGVENFEKLIGDLERACTEASQQIEEKDYMARLKQDGMRQFIKYGIAYYKKDCKVMIGDDSDNT